jgi:hypothetical protein
MALRLIEMYHSRDKGDEIDALLKDQPILATWHDHLQEGHSISKILVKSENTEAIIDLIEPERCLSNCDTLCRGDASAS